MTGRRRPRLWPPVLIALILSHALAAVIGYGWGIS